MDNVSFDEIIKEIPATLRLPFTVSYQLGALFMILAPLLEKPLPMGIWTLEGDDKLHHFVMTEQLIITPCSGLPLWTLDCMYRGFCGEIVVQFKILCQYLKDLTTEVNNFDEMKVFAVSNAVYFSKWYFYHLRSLKLPLLLMMRSAQYEIIIRAGGLVPINTATFVNILKEAWSACSLARGLRRDY
ncbi:hypothetical protein ILUMI_19666 [Ignelater luminosus]|uniref:Uncharacterized protein n=1 Tax=Ignelater luminosus TaxID=2038154 RepID=A0A8K0CLZ7_IGNLU|nr:hypothetical protein ILUMI_19666 [Ignelater luminosus]